MTTHLAAFILAFAADGPPTSKEVTAALNPFVDKGTLAGAVTVVADKDKVLSLDTVGSAAIAGKKPMAADTLFWIASQSKPITAVAVMLLVDDGKLKIDDPVVKHLPEFKNVKVRVKDEKGEASLVAPKVTMTIKHLLSHTSGMPFASAKETPTLDGLTLKDATESYAVTPLHAEPGAKYQYSNAGINTAGRIVEVVSGMPFEKFLDKRLFGPLGMKDTTFFPNKEQVSRLAKAYRPKKGGGLEETKIGQLKYPLDGPGRHPMPAGGLFSTARDVTIFCQMMLNGGTHGGKRILSEESVKAMTTKQTGKLPNGYGLGWSTGSAFGHGGALSTNMAVHPKQGLILIFLVQHAGFPGDGGKSHGAFVKAALDKFAR
jgi:CubicO group peptidase (beta-lactamase class C family)